MMADRLKKVQWGPGAKRVRTSPANWKQPLAWSAAHDKFFAQHGRRQRVFCASLADVFDNAVPDSWRADLFELIEQTPNLDWLLLTKRIGSVGNMLPVPFDFEKQYPNVWLGITITSQAEADRDIPKLLTLDATVRFLSMEPLLGPVDLSTVACKPCPTSGGELSMDPSTGAYECCSRCDFTGVGDEWGIDWVIVGGESGPGARPMHPDWARSLRDQCAAAGVPFLFKQWGEWTPGENVERQSGVVDVAHLLHGGDWLLGRENLASADGHVDDEPDLYRVGKKAAGRLLDGVQHDGFPRSL
jgi:protein gp37